MDAVRAGDACRLLADEIEPAVSKVKENIDKLPEAAAKVLMQPALPSPARRAL